MYIHDQKQGPDQFLMLQLVNIPDIMDWGGLHTVVEVTEEYWSYFPSYSKYVGY
jgi:hypothetical protein